MYILPLGTWVRIPFKSLANGIKAQAEIDSSPKFQI